MRLSHLLRIRAKAMRTGAWRAIPEDGRRYFQLVVRAMRDSGYDAIRSAEVLAVLSPIVRLLESFKRLLIERGRRCIIGWLAKVRGPIAEALALWAHDDGYCEYVGLTWG
ncbi:MAG: hypothetical protein QXQ76_03110 [Candidatus Bathyarchaeia archaeon]